MVRKALMQDINEIMEIIQDAKELLKRNNSLQWQDADGYPNQSTILNDIKKGWLYVNKKAVIAGVLCLAIGDDPSYEKIDGAWLNDRKYNTIHRLAVKKDFYRQGIGKELIEYAMANTLKAGLLDIRADTTTENQAMNNLLLYFGFIRCGVIRLAGSLSLNPLRLAYHKVLNNN